MSSQPTRYGRVSPTRRLSADLATLHRINPLEYNSLPPDRSARRQHRRKLHQQHQRRSMVDLPEFGGAKFKQQGSSSSSEDVRAASEDRLLAPPSRPIWGAEAKRSSVGGRRRMREEQRRREKEATTAAAWRDPAKRVSASLPAFIMPLDAMLGYIQK